MSSFSFETSHCGFHWWALSPHIFHLRTPNWFYVLLLVPGTTKTYLSIYLSIYEYISGSSLGSSIVRHDIHRSDVCCLYFCVEYHTGVNVKLFMSFYNPWHRCLTWIFAVWNILVFCILEFDEFFVSRNSVLCIKFFKSINQIWPNL